MSTALEIDELKAFINRLKIKDIRCVHLSFIIDETSQVAPNRFEFKLEEKIDYGYNDGIFHFKVAAYAKVLSEDAVIGNLETKFVVIHDLAPGKEITPETTHQFLGSTGIMVAFPYIREIIQSSMARFGLSGVVLDYMHRPD